MKESLIDQVVEQLQELPENLQRRVLDFVQKLKEKSDQEIPGRQLLRFADKISGEDLESMREAIEKECETIDLNEWQVPS